MPIMRRVRGMAIAAALLSLVLGTASPSFGGDAAPETVPRPPFDSGHGQPMVRTAFRSPDGRVACRRVYTEMIWLECLLRDTREIVRFGPDEFATEAPCLPPHGSQTCRIGYGTIVTSPARPSDVARFADARRIPLERLVDLGRRTPPYPVCIADPNLGLSCSTMMDDSVGEQVYLGLAGALWNCPGYEYVDGQTPIPQGSHRCLVVRP